MFSQHIYTHTCEYNQWYDDGDDGDEKKPTSETNNDGKTTKKEYERRNAHKWRREKTQCQQCCTE